MNNKIIAGAVALSVAFVVLSDTEKTDIKPISSETKIGSSILHYDDAGNKFYIAQAKQSDGGISRVSVPPDCARRLPDASVSSCLRRLSDGGTADPGTFNRFDAVDAVGKNCKLVACGVYFGTDSLREE